MAKTETKTEAVVPLLPDLVDTDTAEAAKFWICEALRDFAAEIIDHELSDDIEQEVPAFKGQVPWVRHIAIQKAWNLVAQVRAFPADHPAFKRLGELITFEFAPNIRSALLVVESTMLWVMHKELYRVAVRRRASQLVKFRDDEADRIVRLVVAEIERSEFHLH